MPIEISLVILNYNGAQWLDRCLESICKQTAVDRLEVIITDNGSTDGSREICERYALRLPALRFINNGKNLWYCEANNIGAADARSPLVFILNNDLWLEPDCIELALKAAAENLDVQIFSVRVVNYDDDKFQGFGASGFDWFGVAAFTRDHSTPREFCGVRLRIHHPQGNVFQGRRLSPEFLIYGDELDLGWRVCAAGGRAMSAPTVRVHHRGAAVANPTGGTKQSELRTNEMKRFLSVRNGLLVLLKNCQHVLLLLLIPHLVMLTSEALFFLVMTRNWQFVKNSYVRGISEAFRMMPHVRAWRKKISGFRRHGDFWMLRFLRPIPTRLLELGLVIMYGLPKVEKKK